MAEATTATPARRPGLITLVGIFTTIKGASAGLMGLAFLVALGSDDVADALGTSDQAVLVTSGVLEIIFAILFLSVASGVFGGAPWARVWLTIICSVRLAAVGLLSMNGPLDAAFTGYAYPLLATILPITILVIIWGLKTSEDFFGRP